MKAINIGVLALQGAFAKHIEMLRSLDVKACEVRKPEELKNCDALIIPGGESTTMMKHMEFIDFIETFKAFAKDKPVFGTCAGLILMSKEIIADSMQPFGLLNVFVERNAFGRQADSFHTDIELRLESGKPRPFPAFFIRAPRIRQTEEDVKILAVYNNEPVLVQQGHHLGATFHPELSNNPIIHAHFVKIICHK